MDKPQSRKRQRSDDRSQNITPAKRPKLNFSPAFWDRLSEIPLTARALRELDRRNKTTRPSVNHPSPKVHTRNLGRFARHGGPDLRHLRGV